MDVEAKKLDLIDWLVNLQDEAIIEKVMDLKKDTAEDWYDELPEAAKVSIRQGLNEAREGNLKAHDKVMGDIAKKYNIKR